MNETKVIQEFSMEVESQYRQYKVHARIVNGFLIEANVLKILENGDTEVIASGMDELFALRHVLNEIFLNIKG